MSAKKTLLGISTGIFTGLYLIMGILGGAIHIWTIIAAYEFKGLFVGFVTFMSPFASQAYWMYFSWRESDTFFTIYNTVILTYCGVWVLILCLAIFSGYKYEKISEEA